MLTKRRDEGSITIYMTLILSVLLSLYFMLIDGARKNAISLQAECAFDLAVYSVFAEYNRQLMEQYDLLFVDTSYGEASPSINQVKNHLAYYINENLSSSEKTALKNVDFTKTFLETNDIETLAYATDEDGGVFERQAVLYMKQKYGVSYLKKLQDELQQADDMELFTKDITAQREENQKIIDATEIPKKDTGKKDKNGDPIMEDVTLDNPADRVNSSRPKGILYLVTQKENSLSEQMVAKEKYISSRKAMQKGCGLKDRDSLHMGDSLWFDLYIMDHCGTYRNPKEEGGLQYQVEYILGEKNNDIDNLKYVVNRLLLIRETANMAYLFTDTAKLAEAEALAATITTAAGVPLLLEPVKLTILFAWSFAESIRDVKCLLDGKRIPIMKTFETWYFSLEGMLNYEAELGNTSIENGESTESGQSIKDGLSYEDYLRLFLVVKNHKDKVHGMMDIVEMDLRCTKGNENFCIDGCSDYMTLSACVGSKYGFYHEMERTFYYQ